MAQYGAGGSGGTIDVGIQPFIANPKQFIFLNGNSGVTGNSSGTSTTASATNANVGVGGNGSGTSGYAGGAGGGAGGAGAYIKVVYGAGQIPNATVLNYFIGNAGGNGTNGGIKITWT